MSIKVIKASAGSGKTHRLTNDYINLLRGGSNHNQILAVTFTNKATEEMKSRIVKTLNKLATEEKDKKAEEFRNKILHDYSHFNVSTIDKFFQKIVRSMFRELGFSGLYNLILDNTQLINDSVDEMRVNLDQYTNVYSLLLEIAMNKLKEEKDWSFSSVLKSLTYLLWKEDFMKLSKEQVDCYNYENVKDFYNSCTSQKEEIIDNLSQLAENAKKSFTSVGLNLEDSNRGILKVLDSFREKKIKILTDSQLKKLSLETALTRENYKKYSEALKKAGFDKNINNFAKAYVDKIKNYCTINVVLSYATYLPVIVEIKKLIRDRLDDRNELILSEINYLLSGMIGENDAPFIFEKVGTQINNYLLDEFQDTSSMQWGNFIPLIDNSSASGYESLVVGDVKQSIYRWRNSDWNILKTEIKGRYGAGCKEETLEDNWRSKANIVDFNNTFFSKMVSTLDDDEVKDAYSDVKQSINKKREHPSGGYVNVKLWNVNSSGKEKDYKLEEFTAVLNDIKNVTSYGYKLKDIAILVRYNSYGIELSKYLLENQINVISSESLLVSSANEVKLLIHLLKMSVSGDSAINKLVLEKLRTFNDDEREEILKASDLPLFEQVERYIQILGLNKKESIAYVQAFQDLVYNYNQKNSSDINGFLSWWDLEGCGKSIEGASGVDAVNILSIHKSKGLDFPIVMVPNCEWPINFNDEIMWFKNKIFPEKLPLVPLKVVKELEKTEFKDDYLKEMLYRKIDNLNLLYVAFTRPRNALYIYSAPVRKQDNMYKWLQSGMAEFKEDENNENKEDITIYSFGELLKRGDDEELKKKEEEQEKEKVTLCDCGYPSVDYKGPMSKVNLKFQTEDSLNQHEGNVLHGILQNIRIAKDAPKAIERAIRMGVITMKEGERINTELNEIFDDDQTKSWFDGTYTKVWNERTIISNELFRPDRIMEKDGELLVVDYKFGAERDVYKKQLSKYIELLENMNKWNSIKGCLYYHKNDKNNKVLWIK